MKVRIASYTTFGPWSARRTQDGKRPTMLRMCGKGQATGGGRFWIGPRAGRSATGAGRRPGVAKPTKPNDSSAKAGSGSVGAAGNMECALETTEPRRRQESASAGFWIACRSSVTEITGNRMSRSTARATNCDRRSCVRCSGPVSGAKRSHSQNMTAASSTQARLSTNSILRADSTSSVYVSEWGILCSILHNRQ